jgi:hypothetical protein
MLPAHVERAEGRHLCLSPFAIDGDDFVGRGRPGDRPKALEPTDQTALQDLGANGLKHPPERVMRRDAARQFQEVAAELLLGPPELLDLDEVFATAQHAARADDQDIDQATP